MAITKLQPFNLDTTANYTFANITTDNANLGNAATANFFIGNGSLLTGITVSAGNSIVNGNSNVSVSANGNVTTSVAGNSGIFTVTGTGVNVSGTLNSTGNANVGNLGATGIYATTLAGSLTTASQPNITSIGTLSSLGVTGNITSGNANLGNAVTANYFIGNLYGTANTAASATTAGTVTTAAQPNITSVGTLTDLTVANTVTVGQAAYGAIAVANTTGFYTTWSTAQQAAAWTVSFWVYIPTQSINYPRGLFYNGDASSGQAVQVFLGWNGASTYSLQLENRSGGPGSNFTKTLSGAVSQNAWHFVTVSYNGTNTVYLGLDGDVSAVTGSAISSVYAGLAFGKGTGSSGQFNTYGPQNYTDVELTLGTASYTSNFTPPTTHPTTAGKTLLLLAKTAGTYITNEVTGSNVSVNGSPTFDSSNPIAPTGTLTVAVNSNLGNAATANYFIGSGANLTNIPAGNISGQVGNSLVAGTVYTNAQPNITSVGTLSNLTSNGTVDFTNASNVSLGPVGNVHITGGSSGQYLSTDGSGTLSWATVSSGSASISNGNSNVNIPSANGNVNISAVGNANVLVITGTGANITGTANISGNLSAGNITTGAGSGGNISGANVISANILNASDSANLGNSVVANYFTGNFYGTANLATYATTANSVAGGNVSGQVGNSLVAGTVYTNAQPNITSVGTLSNLTSNGTVDFTNASNVALGPVANVHITGGSSGQYLSTDGSGGLSWATVAGGSSSNISNGNSNVNIPSANGNITMSAVGNANIVVVTGTGIVVTGTANVSGNLTAGNITTGAGTGGNITGANVISANILNASDSANLGNSVTANYFIGSGANLTSIPAGNISGQVGNALVSGTVYTNAQPNITSVGTLSNLTSTGTVNLTGASNVALGPVGNVHITGGSSGQYLSTDGSGTLSWATVATGSATISNGNSNVNIPAANGNVNISAVGNANVLVITGTGANITGTLNVTGNAVVGNLLSSGSGGNVSNVNVISANTFIASGNITAGNANLGNSVTANYFIGNLYGNANSATTATTAGTVTTAAQPNITSVGTLTSLAVSGTGSFGGNVNLNSFNITSLATPVASTDAATKQYVDDVAQGLNVHDAAAAATPDTLANVTSGTITYNNGSSGVGANLTTTGTFDLIDGVNVQTSGTRILVKNEANAVYNGIYTWSNATVITRATDYNSVPEVEAGDFIFVTGGTLYDNTGWVQTSTVTAIGTAGNNIDFAQFSGAGTYQAGTGLTLTGTTFSVNASQTQVTSVGTLGNLTVSGNATVGNLITSGSGGNLTSINVVSANTFIASGNITAGNASLGNSVTANYFTGNFYGTANLATYATTANSVAGSNVSGQVANALVAGTVYTNAQPNITSVGTLSSLTSTGTIDFTGASNTSLGPVANVHITGGSSGQYLQTDGSGTLSWATVASGASSNISNGNSNVNIPAANGNVNISAVGNANVLVITGTGANVTGTLNVTGNATVGNLITSGSGGNLTNINVVSANTFTASGNITAGNLIGPLANGNSNVNIPAANGNVNISAVGTANVVVVTGTGANIAGALDVTGNLTAGNLISSGTGGNITNANVISANTLLAVANVTAPQFISNVATGTAPFVVTSTTQVANLNVATAGSATNASAVLNNVQTTGTYYPTFISATSNGNYALASNTAFSANLANGGLIATTFVGALSGAATSATTAGTVTTAAQPNITSVGTLTALTVGPNSSITLSGTSGFVKANSIQGTDGTAALYPGYNAVSGAVGVRTDLTVGAGGTGNLIANAGDAIFGDASTVTITGGTSGQVLSTDGAGNLSWATAGGGSASISNGTSNVNIATSGGNVTTSVGGNANVLIVTGTGANIAGTLNVSGNATVGNLVTGAGSGGSIAGGNSVSANYLTGTLTTAAQPNITSVGSLTGLTVSNATGVVDFTTTANVTLGAVGNLHISGGTSGYVLSTDGSGALSWVAQSGGGGGASISNGTSNVNIATSGGNVTVGVGGTANVLTITSTGANITGTANITGNTVVGNLTAGAGSGGSITGANLVSANFFTGTLTTAAQPNITSLGSLSGLTVSNASGVVNFITTANVSLGAVGNVKITGGTANQFLQTNGSGTLTWATPLPTITDNTSASTTYYPVYATSSSGSLANAGITTTKLQFVPSTGTLTVTDLNTLSDATLKENPVAIENPMEVLMQLFGMGFNWIDSKKKSYGLMAQMVEKILPELVSTNAQGQKAVNYIPIIAFLIEAVKKQQEDIEALKKR